MPKELTQFILWKDRTVKTNFKHNAKASQHSSIKPYEAVCLLIILKGIYLKRIAQICLNHSKIYNAISVTHFDISSGRKNSKTRRITPLFIVEPHYQINLIGYRENIYNRLLSSICKINKMNWLQVSQSKKVWFFTVNRQKCRFILTVKTLRYFK